MTRTPKAHRARRHDELLAGLEGLARHHFADAPRRWDPVGAPTGSDPGHGVLDCVAAALDVVWSYQHAWADESFLPLAQLPASASRLLSLIGHAPRPALSAGCLQQLRLKAGVSATIPAGFAVSAPGGPGLDEAVFETDAALRADHRLNTLQPFAVVPPPAVTAIPPSLTMAPPPRPLPTSSASLAEQLASRLRAAQHSAALARDAARARSDALKLADMAATLDAVGAGGACPDLFQQLCAQLCAQANALLDAEAAAAAARPRPMSEAQQLLMGGLARIDASLPGAVAGLEAAVCQLDGEDEATYSARLDGLAGFLDALVEGVLAQARDDVARLRGPRGLSPLDRALRGALNPGQLGVALPGTDRLYLLPQADGDGPAVTQAGLLRPGDHLVVADVVDQPDRDGKPSRQHRGRQAVRVVRVDDQVAPLLGERATHLVFTPALERRHDLARTVLVGNVVPASHGRTRVVALRGPGPWPLPDATDLTWRPDPAAPDGRRPSVQLAVGGRPWTAVPDITSAAPGQRVFDVVVRADAVPVVRTGDGSAGAVVPPDAEVTLTIRTGGGSSGNRPAGAIATVVAPVPEVVGTTNPLAATGGVDGEPPEQARLRAVGGVRTLDRAVTPDDVTALLLGHGLVARAAVGATEEARPRRLRAVVSGVGGRTLHADELATLSGFLGARVPPGVTITLVNRAVVELRAVLTLALASTADPLTVVARARARLGVDRDDEPGLLDPDRVDLGQTVHLSDLHRALAGLDGLHHTVVEAFHRAGEPPRRADAVAVADGEEPRWAPAVDGVDGVVFRWAEAVDR
ncbi:MAG: hypothetical protein ACK5RL_06595 [Acidimicrobiales bacterium]